jgi:polyhydroxyalkanoate depolymerase
MLYMAYEAQRAVVAPWKLAAGLTGAAIASLPEAWAEHPVLRWQRAWCEVVSETRLIHDRPRFGIDTVTVAGASVDVEEQVVLATPFGRLLHFAKEKPVAQPRVLIVAALAGHFSTLLRDTVQTMLEDHDVYLAEWLNARDVPLDEGSFGLDDYVAHLMRFIETLGGATHVLAVCQPCPAAIAATAVMAAEDNPATPRTLTLLAGPVDTSRSPTAVNELATRTPLSWFADNAVTVVPPSYGGAGRRVYPGFLQLSAFVAMNPARHVAQHLSLLRTLAGGDRVQSGSIRAFYDEYFAVLDLHADFYLDTIDAVFQRNLLATGALTWRGKPVEPAAVTKTALLTVEGEQDDICGLGQTLAAHDVMTGIKPSDKAHHLQAGVGHYGVFAGRRWRQEVYPVVRDHILLHA